jgi:hypothetical protein
MYSKKNVDDILQFLHIEESFIKSRFMKEIKSDREISKPQTPLQKRPSWSGNTKPIEEPIVICSWPTGTETGDCTCRLCHREELHVDDRFKNFKDKLLNLENVTEINDFIIVNNKYIASLFETKLVLIRHELLMAKWRKAINPILAVSKFRSILKKRVSAK